MFRKFTTIILGAGASAECELPLGSALLNTVASALKFRFDLGGRLISGEPYIYDLLQRRYGRSKIGRISQASNALAAAAPNFTSIDEALNYFGAQPDIVTIGKLAIVYSMVSAENASKLEIDRQTGRPNIDKLRNTWYDLLFSIAISGLRKENINEIFANVQIINFNYDRTLECFLFHALTGPAGIAPTDAADIVGNLRVVRPYGSLGNLDWHRPGTHIGGLLDDALFAKIDGIRTFTEAHQENVKVQINQALDQSELVVVLGFGFHSQNMALFSPSNQATRSRGPALFVTAKDIHPENLGAIRGALQRDFLTTRILLLDMTAHEILSSLRPSIAAAAA
jgi:hypothetical protein